MTQPDRAYTFVYRALLTEEALDRAGRQSSSHSDIDHQKIAELLSLDAMDEEYVENARAMGTVYTAIAAFENSVRDLVAGTLLENVGEGWWQGCVSEKIRKQADLRQTEEEKVRWHTQRGEDPIQYTTLPNLLNIIRNNFEHFEPFLHDIDWSASIFDTVERSRNVIMHSGTLGQRDIARVGALIRDWTSQVAA